MKVVDGWLLLYADIAFYPLHLYSHGFFEDLDWSVLIIYRFRSEQNKQIALVVATGVVLFGIAYELNRRGTEITWKEFVAQYLTTGMVTIYTVTSCSSTIFSLLWCVVRFGFILRDLYTRVPILRSIN